MTTAIMNYLWLFCLLPLVSFAQFSVSGRVVSQTDKKPVAAATVFLNNSTGGTITADDGSFTLANVKTGQYDLIVSCIGYQTYYQKVIVTNSPVILPLILFLPKLTQLKEVNIKASDTDRGRYIEMFLKEFLGSTANAAQCKLLNPEELYLKYNRQINTLTASSFNYLVLENKALGYKLYYQLDHFEKNFSTGMLYYDGPVRFEEIQNKAAQQKRWAQRRLAAYKGSSMHFFRSVYNNRFSEEDFNVLRLVRKLNPSRPPDSVLRIKMKIYSVSSKTHPDWQDSTRYYSEKFRLSKTVDYRYKTPLTTVDFLTPAPNDLKSMRYTDYLYVVYTKKASLTGDATGHPTTILALNTLQALFDRNGILADPNSIIYRWCLEQERSGRYAAG